MASGNDSGQIHSMHCQKCGKEASEYDTNKWKCLHCGSKFIYEAPQVPDKFVKVSHVTEMSESSFYVCANCGGKFARLTNAEYQCSVCQKSLCPKDHNPSKNDGRCDSCQAKMRWKVFPSTCFIVIGFTLAMVYWVGRACDSGMGCLIPVFVVFLIVGVVLRIKAFCSESIVFDDTDKMFLSGGFLASAIAIAVAIFTAGSSTKPNHAAVVPQQAAEEPEIAAARERDRIANERRPKFGDKVGAWLMAQEFVNQHLVSPGTADYGGVLDQNYETCVVDLDNGRYLVKGWVDSQNRFGAKLRTDFVCALKFVSENKYICESINLTPR